jgi:hypothetical protein
VAGEVAVEAPDGAEGQGRHPRLQQALHEHRRRRVADGVPEEYVKGRLDRKTPLPRLPRQNYKVGDYDPTGGSSPASTPPSVCTRRTAKFCAHITLAKGHAAEHERCFWVVDL